MVCAIGLTVTDEAGAYLFEPTELVDTRRDDRWLEVSMRYYAIHTRPAQFNEPRSASQVLGLTRALELRGQANFFKNDLLRLDGYIGFNAGTRQDIFDVIRDTEQLKLTAEWNWLKGFAVDIGRQGAANVGTGNPPREGNQPGMTYYWAGLSYTFLEEDARWFEAYLRNYFETGQAGLITEKFGVPNTPSQLLQKEVGLKFHQSIWDDQVRFDAMPYLYLENSFTPQMYGGYVVADYAIGSVVKWLNPQTYGFKGRMRLEAAGNYSKNTSYVLTTNAPNDESRVWLRLKWEF